MRRYRCRFSQIRAGVIKGAMHLLSRIGIQAVSDGNIRRRHVQAHLVATDTEFFHIIQSGRFVPLTVIRGSIAFHPPTGKVVDNIIGIKFIAVAPLNAFAQIQIKGLASDETSQLSAK